MTQGLCGSAQTPRSVLQGASCERLEGPLERDSPETDRVEILPSRACLLSTRSSVSVMHLTVMNSIFMHVLCLAFKPLGSVHFAAGLSSPFIRRPVNIPAREVRAKHMEADEEPGFH